VVSADAWHEQARWGPYLLVRRIGSGGMGCVFEAQDTVLKHRVAVKLLHPHVAGRPRAAERFLREGRAAASVRHPHVVQVFGLGTEAGTAYLAMELLEQETLAALIAREGARPLEAALDIVIPVAAAVAAAHDAGVIHRDVKPSNVCFTRLGGRLYPKVVDFGVSKVIGGEVSADTTAADGMIGTAAYMAPEQARSAGGASFLSDQYSLGVVLYQCVTGAVPYSGANVYDVLQAVMSAPLVAPGSRVKGIPRAFDDVVARALSRLPQDRFPSVREFAAALLPFASEATRSAFTSELCTPSASAQAPGKGAETTEPGWGQLRTLSETTRPPTTRDSPLPPRPWREHALWIGLAVMATIGLVARGLIAHATPSPSVRASSGPPVLAEAARVETTNTEPSARVAPPVPTVETTVPVATRSLPAVAQPKSGAKPVERSRPSRAPVPAGAASWTVGDNGSPILPL